MVLLYSNTTADKVLEETLEFPTFEGLILKGYSSTTVEMKVGPNEEKVIWIDRIPG